VPAAESLAAESTIAEWPGFRGPKRDAIVPWLPKSLPAQPTIVWSVPMTSPALAGIAATRKYVVVADRGLADQTDLWRCFDAETGQPLWKLEYDAQGRLDWGNSPRATPLILGDVVYLQGGFGDLHCVGLKDGKVHWKRNIFLDFGAKPLVWGMCVSPLIVDDKLIVSPGAIDASLAALDPATGKTLWKTPGRPAAYASFIVGTFGGRRQVVGYDSTTLGGWDIATGSRLWQLVPEEEGDFNVPTPINLGGKLLVSSENNGTRLYEFADDGTIRPEPLGQNWDLRPDTATPVAIGDRLFGCFGGELFCLDLRTESDDAQPLKDLWIEEDDAYLDHVSVIGHAERILVSSCAGELLLLTTSGEEYELLGRLSIFGDDCELMSHPALVGTRIFMRDGVKLVCVELKEE
jgi:outer membrane protein assembly factor BamB